MKRPPVRIGERWVGMGAPCFVIAEIGINHNGSLDLARKLIDGAYLAGADAVKFQKRTPERCVPPEQWNLERDTPWGRMTYIDYRRRMELGAREFAAIDRHCRERGILWFASCWDEESVEFIERYDPPCYKAASASLTTDLLLYALLQSYICALLIAASVEWVDARTGLSHLGLVSRWPVAAQVAFFVVTHDLYIYWFHRWQHHSPRLWRLHEAHHSVSSVDWLAGARSHTFEILINQTIEFAPMLLLGAAPEVILIKGMISGIWGMYIHSNLDVRTGWLQLLINGPEAHRWHHSTDLRPPGMNFSTKLAIWDVLFGTLWLPRGSKPTGYGLVYVAFPKGYLRQHLFAFRPLPSPPVPPPEG